MPKIKTIYEILSETLAGQGVESFQTFCEQETREPSPEMFDEYMKYCVEVIRQGDEYGDFGLFLKNISKWKNYLQKQKSYFYSLQLPQEWQPRQLERLC